MIKLSFRVLWKESSFNTFLSQKPKPTKKKQKGFETSATKLPQSRILCLVTFMLLCCMFLPSLFFTCVVCSLISVTNVSLHRVLSTQVVGVVGISEKFQGNLLLCLGGIVTFMPLQLPLDIDRIEASLRFSLLLSGPSSYIRISALFLPLLREAGAESFSHRDHFGGGPRKLGGGYTTSAEISH